jgi:hypothetical protein
MSEMKHMGIAKRMVLMAVRERDDWRETVVLGFEGTREEAIKAIEADPREVFCDCKCAKLPDGSCSGKPA